jgi:YMGG-like Gly-zipper
MLTLKITMTMGVLALAGACSRGADARPDDALKNDLALAAQVQPYQPQQFTSPTEQAYAAPGMAQQYTAVARAPQPVYRAPAPVYRAPARRTASRSSSRSSSASSGTYYPEPERRVVKHTKRDAAIGAGAGAVIGAMTSRDKLKGGLIGAAAGGILGAVIGNNVDVQRP